MEHIYHLCADHQNLAWFVLALFVLAGFGIGLGIKMIFPMLSKMFRQVNVNVGTSPAHKEPLDLDGPACLYPCPAHEAFHKFVVEIQAQQKANISALTELRLHQSANEEVIAEFKRQQGKMWEKLDAIPVEFGVVKGQLGEIKGLVTALHKLYSTKE